MCKTIDLDFGLVSRMAVLVNETQIFVVDNINEEIKVVDLNENAIVRKIKPISSEGENILVQPLNIFILGKDKFFLTNYKSESILVFNGAFEFVSEIKNVVASGNVIDYMDVDDENSDILYLVDNQHQKVTVYNMNACEKAFEFKATEPWNIRVKNDKLLLISFAFWDWSNKKQRILKRISRGDNCIYVLDKKTFKVKDVITIDGWLRPDGLCLDADGNIFTTAFMIDKESSIVSDYRYLFIFNQNHQLLRELYLEQIHYISDFLLTKTNKLLFCGGDTDAKQWLKVYEIK